MSASFPVFSFDCVLVLHHAAAQPPPPQQPPRTMNTMLGSPIGTATRTGVVEPSRGSESVTSIGPSMSQKGVEDACASWFFEGPSSTLRPFNLCLESGWT